MFSWLRSAPFVCRQSELRPRHEWELHELNLTIQLIHFVVFVDRWCEVECFQFDSTPRSKGSLETLFSRLPTVDYYMFNVLRGLTRRQRLTIHGTSNNVSRHFHSLSYKLLWLQLLGSSTWYDDYYLYFWQ